MLFTLEPVHRPSPQGMKVKAGGSAPGNRQPPGNADPEGVERMAIFRHGAHRYDPFRVAAEWRWAWLPGVMPPATLSIPFGDSLLRFVTGMVPLAQSEQYCRRKRQGASGLWRAPHISGSPSPIIGNKSPLEL